MSRLQISALLLTLTLSLIYGDTPTIVDQDSYDCSHGNLQYLCENFEICSKYGLITEEDKELCGAHNDPIPGEENMVDMFTTKTPPIREPTTLPDNDYSTSREKDGYSATTESPTDSSTYVTYEKIVTDERITSPFYTNDNGVNTEESTTDNRIETQEPSTEDSREIEPSTEDSREIEPSTGQRHSRDFESVTPVHTRDGYTVTGTDNSYTTASGGPDDSSDTTPSKGTDDSYTTVSSAFSTEAGTEATAVIGTPPVITVPPVNITVAPGGTGRLDCTAMAATTPQITITRKDQTTVPDLENFIGASGNGASQTTINSITINNVDIPNEGWYTCQAANKYGYVRQDAYLHVKDLCIGSVCPGDKTCEGNYEEGEGYKCVCPSYCEFTELFQEDYVCSNYCEDMFNECQMKTDACQNDKDAIAVMNRGRCGRIEFPEIEEQEDEYGVKELFPGDDLQLECHATGFPEPDIKWYKGTQQVGEGNELFLTVNEGDTGEYICEVVNCMKSKISKRLAMVFVNELPTTPPAATSSPSPTPGLENIVAAKQDIARPRSTCAVFGDPHFLTYDQTAFSYMGTCDNVLAMDCEFGRWFVYGRMRPCGKTGGSCLETVTAYVDYEVLELQRGWLVNQNGKKIVPKNHKNEKMVIEGQYNNFTLLFDGAILTLSAVLNRVESNGQFEEDKLVIHWDGYVSVQIQTPQNTKTCGMCGNNDGKPDNDMRMRRRGMTDDPVAFGNSWMIDPMKRCEEAGPAKTPEEVCGDKYEETKAECERIFNIAKFQACRDLGHDTSQWIESCIYDECEGLMQRDDLPPKCIVAGAYAMRCGNDFWGRENANPTNNQQLEGWEKEAECPDADARFQPVLDTGCPQPTLEEEKAGKLAK